VLAGQATFNLLFFPYFCVLLAFNLSREAGEKLSLRRPRLNIGTIMVLIAYLGLLFGVAVEGNRIGGAAQRYHQQRISAAEQSGLFRGLALKGAAEAPVRRNNARELRAGKIPDKILEDQKTFLKSLETTATPEYRTYRYGLIADGEDLQGRMAEANLAEFGKLADYLDQLAAKYARAEKRPWEPVPPDPPRP
jgi:hypothetical protein